MRQPDFGSFFPQQSSAPIAYEVRGDANLRHDVSYLSSYLHDARFTATGVNRDGPRLAIQLDRDRWELWRGGGDEELISIPSQLTLAPTARCAWTFGDPLRFPLPPDWEFVIDEVVVGEGDLRGNGVLELVLRNRHAGWRLAVGLVEEGLEVRLRDDAEGTGR